MRTDILREFATLRQELTEEKAAAEARLKQINEALGEVPATQPGQPARQDPSAAGSAAGMPLKTLVVDVLSAGAKSKQEILKAVQDRGYRFSTKDPMNSLGVVLYGNKAKFLREGGLFSLRGGRVGARGASRAVSQMPRGKRQMSPEARARIAAAARRRWAKAKKAGRTRL